MDQVNQQPRLITEATRPPERQQRLERLQVMIARRPGVFQRAFEELSIDATGESYDIGDERISTVGISLDPKDLIKEYFAKRDDRGVSFDEASDDALMADREYRDLSTASSNTHAVRVKIGSMSSTMRANPEADPARDAARRYMFGFYLGRAVAWSEQQATARKSLPSTG